jgi:ferredoxin
MNGLFLNITKEEKENILDKHKTLYDGYAVNSQPSNMTPLYTQDFANDKGGVTVNSKGEVSQYNNKIYMKESKNVCDECGLYEDVCECGKGYGDMEEENYDVEDINKGNKFDYVEDECMECGDMYEGEIDTDYLESNEVKPEAIESLKESLDMFKRFKKYN